MLFRSLFDDDPLVCLVVHARATCSYSTRLEKFKARELVGATFGGDERLPASQWGPIAQVSPRGARRCECGRERSRERCRLSGAVRPLDRTVVLLFLAGIGIHEPMPLVALADVTFAPLLGGRILPFVCRKFSVGSRGPTLTRRLAGSCNAADSDRKSTRQNSSHT